MDKWRFVEVLRREGYKVLKDAAYPTVVASVGEKNKLYAKVKLLANKVGYKHTFGIIESNITTTVIDDEDSKIESKVIDWPEEEDGEEM